MLDLSIIKEIEECSTVKLIKKYCSKILKKFSVKSKNDMNNLSDLVTLLYVFDMYDEVKKVCEIMKDIEFDGNYTLWSHVEFIRFTTTRILKEQNRLEEVDSILSEVNALLDPTLFKNEATCLELYDKNIANAEQFNFKSEARDWKLLKLKKMINFLEIEDFPLNKENLAENITLLKNELKNSIK